MHSFAYTNLSGASTVASLIEASDGALYGTTFSDASAPNGTVFKVNKDGTGHVVLRALTGTGADGRTKGGTA